jgi:hypothetical protein
LVGESEVVILGKCCGNFIRTSKGTSLLRLTGWWFTVHSLVNMLVVVKTQARAKL